MPTLDPVTPQPHLSAFSGFGIELEYMIVDRASLVARPLAECLLTDDSGMVQNEIDHGELAWSNELVAHVIELKTNGPAARLLGLDEQFAASVGVINGLLREYDAMLLPGAMHPLFEPAKETRLWPHGQKSIYQAYDRIFGCSGHGWSNLQSMHINLPFADDEEFTRLHAAVRLVLALIPALSAASPLEEGRYSPWLDGRLRYYRDNQRAVPSISGLVVPETVVSIEDYRSRILAPMYREISAHDPSGILQDDWLNSRAAIARFERQTIEIRIIDLQECPAMDLAIAELVVALVKALYEERLAGLQDQQALATEVLAAQLWAAAEGGSQARLTDRGLARLLGVDEGLALRSVWLELLPRLEGVTADAQRRLESLLMQGSLGERIRSRLGEQPGREAIIDCYRELGDCLALNRPFLP